MIARMYLSQVGELKARREEIREEIQWLMTCATRATSRITATRVSGTPKRDSMADRAIALADEREVLKRMDANIAEAIALREVLIAGLSEPRWRIVCRLRYLKGLEWKAVAKEMGVSYRKALYLHADAMKELEEEMTQRQVSGL